MGMCLKKVSKFGARVEIRALDGTYLPAEAPAVFWVRIRSDTSLFGTGIKEPKRDPKLLILDPDLLFLTISG